MFSDWMDTFHARRIDLFVSNSVCVYSRPIRGMERVCFGSLYSGRTSAGQEHREKHMERMDLFVLNFPTNGFCAIVVRSTVCTHH